MYEIKKVVITVIILAMFVSAIIVGIGQLMDLAQTKMDEALEEVFNISSDYEEYEEYEL